MIDVLKIVLVIEPNKLLTNQFFLLQVGDKVSYQLFLLLVESLVHLSGFESSVHLQPGLISSIVSFMKRSIVMWKI